MTDDNSSYYVTPEDLRRKAVKDLTKILDETVDLNTTEEVAEYLMQRRFDIGDILSSYTFADYNAE